jgi:hypothetical protein
MTHTLDQSLALAGGRVTIFDDPRPDRLYSLGLDFGLGLPDGDFDAGVILDNYGDQVATLHGRWGNVLLLDVLLPLLDWYQPFIVGERQAGGLEVLRQLYDRGYWLYYQRAEDRRHRTTRDSLGHHAGVNDIRFERLRRALSLKGVDGKPRENGAMIRVRDAEVLSELALFQFLPTSSAVPLVGARDHQLAMGAPAGQHDDLVDALAYAWMGQIELPKFADTKPKVTYKPTALGSILKHDQVNAPPPKTRNRLRTGI